MSNISSCEFFIVIVGSVFDPTQVWNKYFPVIPSNRRENDRQIRCEVQ